MDLISKYAGVDFKTPEDARHWLDNHRGLTDREKRRVGAWISAWETELGRSHVERLNNRTARIEEERGRLKDDLKDGQQQTAAVERAVATGRMSAADGRRELTRLERKRRECLAVQKTLIREVERWNEDAERSPSELLRESQERFQVGLPTYGTRTLTMAILKGEGGE